MKRILVLTALVLAGLVGAFLWGRSTAPERVEERTVEKIVYQDRVVEKVVEVKVKESDNKKGTKTTKTEVKKPDGTYIIKYQTIEIEREVYKEGAVKVEEREKIVYRDREVEKLKVVEHPQPKWLVGASVGVQPNSLSPIYGASVDYRLAGPLFVGGWLNVPQNEPTNIQAGIAIKAQF